MRRHECRYTPSCNVWTLPAIQLPKQLPRRRARAKQFAMLKRKVVGLQRKHELSSRRQERTREEREMAPCTRKSSPTSSGMRRVEATAVKQAKGSSAGKKNQTENQQRKTKKTGTSNMTIHIRFDTAVCLPRQRKKSQTLHSPSRIPLLVSPFRLF